MRKTVRRAFTVAIAVCFGTAFVLPTPEEAHARGGGAFAAGVIGGAIMGAAIAHGLHGRYHRGYRTRRVVRVRAPRDEARQSIIVVQTVLTALDCDPGKITGKMNDQTRDAVRCFQKKKGDPVTGKLTDDQQALLIKIYNDAQQAKTAPQRRDTIDQLFVALGIDAGNSGSSSSGNEPTMTDPNGVTQVVAAGSTSFRGLCRDDAMTTAMRETAKISGSQKLVPDQFCIARSHVLADASAIFKKMTTDQPTLKADDVRGGCASFAGSKRDSVAALTSEEPAALAKRLAKEIGGSEQEREAAIQTSKICLGFGYADDKPDVVMASALFLVGLGQSGYGELVAGGLATGIGAPKDNARAISWLEFTAAEIDGGGASIVNSEAVSRAKILRLMAQELKSGAMVVAQQPAKPNPLGPQFGAHPPTTPQPIPPAQQDDAKGQPAGLNFVTPKPATEQKDASDGMLGRLRDNVVFIWVGDGFGTGFFISPTHILTNTHVVQEVEKALIVSKALRVRPGKPPMVAATVKYRGQIKGVGIDAAILEVVDYKHPTFLKFASDVKEGQPITIAGFPFKALQVDRGYNQFIELIKDKRAPTAGQIPAPKFDTGVVQSIFINNDTSLENLQEGVNTSGGNSGSPVVNACGHVVALHYSATATKVESANLDTSKFNFALTVREIAKFLKDAGIEYQQASEPCQSNG